MDCMGSAPFLWTVDHFQNFATVEGFKVNTQLFQMFKRTRLFFILTSPGIDGLTNFVWGFGCIHLDAAVYSSVHHQPKDVPCVPQGAPPQQHLVHCHRDLALCNKAIVWASLSLALAWRLSNAGHIYCLYTRQ